MAKRLGKSVVTGGKKSKRLKDAFSDCEKSQENVLVL